MKNNACYVGVDGCRGGWLCTLITEDSIQVSLFPELKAIIPYALQAECVFIDMPVGLVTTAGEVREIDVQMRKALPYPFRSCVFTIPCKQAVYADNYKKANEINKKILGKGISIQAWNICAKIKELDLLLSHHPHLKKKFIESHPELCFMNINGTSLEHKKKTKEGIEERINLIALKVPAAKTYFNVFRKKFLKKHVADDDLLDSFVLALKAL